MRLNLTICMLWATAVAAVGQNPLKWNEIQCLGSHNSYRTNTDTRIENFVCNISDLLPKEYDPAGWAYSNAPFHQQLGLHGLRSFELDIHHDPAGGRFAKPAGRLITLRGRKLKNPDWQESGMKLFHIADFDYNTHHILFSKALTEIRDWSLQNPDHLPLALMVELKDFGVSNVAPCWPFTPILPFDAQAIEDLEQEIHAVFGAFPNLIFTPDDFKRGQPTLEAARNNLGWPYLDEMRGKIIFIAMMGEVEKQHYKQGHTNMIGRNMFVFEDEGGPDALFVKVDDPQDEIVRIQNLVRRGYIVRTRADADTEEARSGNFDRLNAAMESGAQMISTDFYRPSPLAGKPGWSHYKAIFPNGKSVIHNPVLRPDWSAPIAP